MLRNTDNELKVTFWGVRGSYPVPGADTVQVGGNTACVEIQVAGQAIILDAGTGIIPLGGALLKRSLKNSSPLQAVLLFSHMHHDHTQGFPFFAPAFVPSTRLHIFGPQTFERALDQVLAQNMIPPVFPVTLQDMGASKEIRAVTENQAILLPGPGLSPQVIDANGAMPPDELHSVRIRLLKSYAHPGSVLVYRIEWRNLSLVYATDTEGYANTDRKLTNFARQTDLLIHDAQYTEEHYLGLSSGGRSTQGWGHSTARMACDVAQAAGARRLALFHHDPGYSDRVVAGIETSARQRFAQAFAAREGQTITLSAAVQSMPHDVGPKIRLPVRV
jgi:phosphoribosyl 1,2-cyclic phosphodiesterase